MYDLIIVGGGPAGLTAAVYAARKKLRMLVLTKEFGGQPMWTQDIENYMGFQFITGPELMEKFEEQARLYVDDLRYEEVIGLAVEADGTFAVTTDQGTYQGRTVILAMGKRPRRLDVPGETEFTGRGVSYCATCDGPLFAGKTVAIVGAGNSAVQAAYELSRVAAKVYLVVRSRYSADPVTVDKMKQADNIVELHGYVSKSITGDGAVRQLVLQRQENREELALDLQGIFVEIGLKPNTEFLQDMVELNGRREIVVDSRCRTSVSGLFAAGDVTDGVDKQIVIAAGAGSQAALAAYEYLFHQ